MSRAAPLFGTMFGTPTPANTPQLTASSVVPAIEDHIIIEVAEADHSEQGMPTLTLAPSVSEAMRRRLLQRRHENLTPGRADTGKVAKSASGLGAMKAPPNSF